MVKVGAQIVGVGGALGQGAGGGGFGAGELVIKVAGVAAGGVEAVAVGAHSLRAAGVQVVFGDDAGYAAGGRYECGAGSVETVAGAAHRGVDPVGLFADLRVVLAVADGGVVLAALGGRGDRGGKLGE